MCQLGLIPDGALAITVEQIVLTGTTDEVRDQVGETARRIDARGKAMLPGFVDAHTHVVFASDRVDEFERRPQRAT